MSNPYTGISSSDDHLDSKEPPPIKGEMIRLGYGSLGMYSVIILYALDLPPA
jgi:hypothetical protein